MLYEGAPHSTALGPGHDHNTPIITKGTILYVISERLGSHSKIMDNDKDKSRMFRKSCLLAVLERAV